MSVGVTMRKRGQRRIVRIESPAVVVPVKALRADTIRADAWTVKSTMGGRRDGNNKKRARTVKTHILALQKVNSQHPRHPQG